MLFVIAERNPFFIRVGVSQTNMLLRLYTHSQFFFVITLSTFFYGELQMWGKYNSKSCYTRNEKTAWAAKTFPGKRKFLYLQLLHISIIPGNVHFVGEGVSGMKF